MNRTVHSSPSSHPPEFPAEIDRATTPAKTEVLLRKGIHRLRVLSESKFRELLNGLVEAAVRERLSALESPAGGKATGAPMDMDIDIDIDIDDDDTDVLILDEGFLDDDELPRDLGETWAALRRKHLGALEKIEARLAQLGETVEAMETSLGRPPRGDETSRDETSPPVSPPLLHGDEPPAPESKLPPRSAAETKRNRQKRRELVLNTFRRSRDSA